MDGNLLVVPEPARWQFSWTDAVSELYEHWPIDVIKSDAALAYQIIKHTNVGSKKKKWTLTLFSPLAKEMKRCQPI